ncbi:MAG: hypothetical protein IJ637_04960, partial [Prevotella sp.]|nr:hypothetical protein [Prevotella sp.]
KFRIHVLIDGPVAGAPWNGSEVAVIEGTCQEKAVARVIGAKMDQTVTALKGKHAIFLKVEADPDARLTLHGIKIGEPDDIPVVPQVTITADGRRISIPAEPLRATNQNGLMDARTYQCYAPLKTSTKLAATANAQGVSFKISPVVDGRATVRATYQGQTKVFLIN